MRLGGMLVEYAMAGPFDTDVGDVLGTGFAQRLCEAVAVGDVDGSVG